MKNDPKMANKSDDVLLKIIEGKINKITDLKYKFFDLFLKGSIDNWTRIVSNKNHHHMYKVK